MEREMSSAVEGIYSAYFTAAAGNSFGMFVFTRGLVAGADFAGGTYAGTYQLDGANLVGSVLLKAPGGVPLITGVSAPAGQPVEIPIPIRFPVPIDPDATYRIDTPAGPVNAKFRKLQDLGP